MVVIYVRVSYLCGVISNISRMRNAINSAQLNKSGVITAAGKQMHTFYRDKDQFLLFHGMNGASASVLHSTISNDNGIHGLRKCGAFSKCAYSVAAAAKEEFVI